MIHPLQEIGHTGYAIAGAAGTVVIEPPLDIAAVAVPGTVTDLVELSIPTWRVSGVRGRGDVTTHAQAAVWWAGVDEAIQPRDGDVIGELLRVESVLDRSVVVVVDADHNDGDVFIGSLDRDPGAAGARAALADTRPGSTFWGSFGSYTSESLVDLKPETPVPLNADAVRLTNLGEVDMVWADPRFRETAASMTGAELAQRRKGPSAPTAVYVAAGGVVDVPAQWAALEPLAIRAEALASSVGRLAGMRNLVVVADDPRLAEMAAGFLTRIGLPTTRWLTD